MTSAPDVSGDVSKWAQKEMFGLSPNPVEAGTVGPGDSVRPGRLCETCDANWQASQKEAEAEKARREASGKKRRRPRPGRREPVEDRPWVLDNMPIADHATLARYGASIRQVSRAEIMSLGRGRVHVGVRDYRRGAEEAAFYAYAAGIEDMWVIVRTGPESWAIAHYERRHVDT